MYARILVPIDGSTVASLALQEAIRLARGRETTIRLLHLVERLPLDQGLEPVMAFDRTMRMMKAAGKRLLQSAKASVRASEVPVQTVMRTTDYDAATAIVREAARWKAQLIVTGAHGLRGTSSVVMGTTAQGVLRNSPCPVLIIDRPGKRATGRTAKRRTPYRRILVPLDGSRAARAALGEAVRLASGHRDATLRLLHVVEPHPVLHGLNLAIGDSWRRDKALAGKEILRNAQALARRSNVHAETVLDGDARHGAVQGIAEEARKWKADVLVIGTRGRRGVSRALLGSHAESVLRSSAVPLMTVRA